MRKNLLLKFADWLETNISDYEFDFTKVVAEYDKEHNCGSVCCAIGWLPTFDKEVTKTGKVKWDEQYHDDVIISNGEKTADGYHSVASMFFGIARADTWVFSPDAQYKIDGWGDFPVCGDDATPKEVANAIRHLISIR